MQRVKRSTAVAVQPAPPAGGTPGFFAQPNPQGGVPATVPGFEWYNNVQEELVGLVLAAGLALADNDPTQLVQSIIKKGMQGCYFNIGTAGGTADAITATYTPAITALTNGMTLYVRGGAVNATTKPTFTPNSGTIAAKTIVKGAGAALAAGDIAGGGHWIELQYDSALDKWVLLNPATGIASQMGGHKNLLINGNFAVNQRAYVSGAATSVANQYTLDRWRVVTSGQNLSWTSAGNTQTVTAPAGGIEQVVESNNISGGTYCLSWAGTATATVNGTAVSNGGTIALTGGVNATVKFSGGTVARAQLEKASSPTGYEDRHFGLELQLCQRYYEAGVANWMVLLGSGTTNGNTFGYYAHHILFKVKKRVTPTVTNTAPPLNPYSVYVGKSADTDGVLFNNSGAYLAQTPTSQNAFSSTWTADAEL